MQAYREAIALLKPLRVPTAEELYALAASYALIHGSVALKEAGVSQTDADAAADEAIATLRRAIAADYRELADLRKNKSFESLMSRSDFAKLLEDLEQKSKSEKE